MNVKLYLPKRNGRDSSSVEIISEIHFRFRQYTESKGWIDKKNSLNPAKQVIGAKVEFCIIFVTLSTTKKESSSWKNIRFGFSCPLQ